jgi:hypothetical protein
MTRDPAKEPWIETPQGSLFFVNALLVAPEFVVLFPLCLQFLVGTITEERAPSPFLDTIPFVASYAIPFLGWLVVVPIWTTVKNLRMELGILPRAALAAFLASHLGFLGYTIFSWIG